MHKGESLLRQGVEQARRGEHEAALKTLKHAATVAEEAGDREYSGQVFLTIIEELKDFLTNEQTKDLYARADQRLAEDVGRQTLQRLRACARLLTDVEETMTRTAGGTLRIPFTEQVRKHFDQARSGRSQRKRHACGQNSWTNSSGSLLHHQPSTQ